MQPNASPLDFMLGLMRDPKVSTDLRIDMAATAAQFVHPSVKGPPKIRLNRFGANGDFSVRRMEGVLTPGGLGAAGGGDFTPLGFLLSVMNDPDATPQQRIRAARVAARYRHAQANADEASIVIEDRFGFKINPVLARSIRADWVRDENYIHSIQAAARWKPLTPAQLEDIYSRDGRKVSAENLAEQKAYNREHAEIKARAVEHLKALQEVECPAAYTADDAEEDLTRLEGFRGKRRFGRKPPREEDAEEAHIAARIAACAANEAPVCSRIREVLRRPSPADEAFYRALAAAKAEFLAAKSA
jgi:hypothetical protein